MEAGIKNHTPHSLRRTFASRCYSNGMKIPQLQCLLGHSSPTTTESYIRNIHTDVETISVLDKAMSF
jgi:integrase